MITNMDTVTVFNGRTEKATRRKIYIPTVIWGVSYVEGKGSKVADNGVWSDDVQYKIRIPLTAVVQNNRVYMRDLNYAKMEMTKPQNTGQFKKAIWSYWGNTRVKSEYCMKMN